MPQQQPGVIARFGLLGLNISATARGHIEGWFVRA